MGGCSCCLLDSGPCDKELFMLVELLLALCSHASGDGLVALQPACVWVAVPHFPLEDKSMHPRYLVLLPCNDARASDPENPNQASRWPVNLMELSVPLGPKAASRSSEAQLRRHADGAFVFAPAGPFRSCALLFVRLLDDDVRAARNAKDRRELRIS